MRRLSLVVSFFLIGVLAQTSAQGACLNLGELYHRVSTMVEGTPVSFRWAGHEFQGTFGTAYRHDDAGFFFLKTYSGQTFNVPIEQIDFRTFNGPFDAIPKGNSIQVQDLRGQVWGGSYEGSFVDANQISLKIRTSDGKQVLLPRQSLKESSIRITGVAQKSYRVPGSEVVLSTEGEGQFVSYALSSDSKARYPARVKRIFDDGTGLKVELEVLSSEAQKGSSLSVVSAESLHSLQLRQSATSKRAFLARDRKSTIIREFGEGAPGFQLVEDAPTQNSRLNHEGKKFPFYNFLEDRSYALSKGRIFDDASVGDLSPGKYTYVFTADGGVSFGRVEDSWEFGSKHMHLANGRKVVAAGELEVYSTGGVVYNFESGTFTRTILKKNPEAEDNLTRAVEVLFQKELGTRSLKEVDPGTIIGRLPQSGPGREEMLRLCADPAFEVNRMKFCPPEILKSLGR